MAETFIRKHKIRPGKTDRLREWIGDMKTEAQADSHRVQEIWAEETLHTISLFIEHAEDGKYLVWYLEAESMEQLVTARRASTHPLHDIEDEMMETVLEEPAENGEFEPLLHGVSADRPDDFDIHHYGDVS